MGRVLAYLVLAALASGLGSRTASAVPPSLAARHAQAQLRAVQAQIARVVRQVSQSRIEQDRLTRRLRATEKSAGAARAALQAIRRQRAAAAARRAALAAERQQCETDLHSDRQALTGELRAAYLIGREGPLTLLLDHGDPSRIGRMFVYYSYFTRQRSRRIRDVETDLKRIDQLDANLRAEDAHLQSLEQQRQAQFAVLEQAGARRERVLATLAARTRTRAQRLALLRRQQAALQSLLAALRRAEARLPAEHEHFGRLEGHLPWPVAGRLIARFGQPRAGGLRWDGDLIATQPDAPVHAVGPGRVIYADWLAGLGLLIIIDHGGGYMSLYGHNDRLYARVGQEVAAGQMIAEAGDTGGASRPELYFGIRRGTQPVDPRLWLERHAR